MGSLGRSVSQLPAKSVSLCLAKCVSLLRPRFPDRSVRLQGLTFPSMAILERTMATLLELALLLVLDMASPLVQEDIDMVINWSVLFLLNKFFPQKKKKKKKKKK